MSDRRNYWKARCVVLAESAAFADGARSARRGKVLERDFLKFLGTVAPGAKEEAIPVAERRTRGRLRLSPSAPGTAI